MEKIDAAELEENSVGALQKMCRQRDWVLPTYERKRKDPNESLFSISCHLLQHCEEGCGPSIKKARQDAAKNMFKALEDTLEFSTDRENGDKNKTFTESAVAGACGVADKVPCNANIEKIEANPVGALQEICARHGWAEPIYKTDSTIDEQNQYIFSVTCTVLSHREKGQQRSMKKAKREAARKMLTRLEASALENGAISKSACNESKAIKGNEQAGEIDGVAEIHGDHNTEWIEDNVKAFDALVKICAKRGLAPPSYQFELGQLNQKYFLVTCSVQHYHRQGRSTSFRKAKRSAALQMINILDNGQICNTFHRDEKAGVTYDDNAVPIDLDSEEISIGALEDMCKSRDWPIPIYETEGAIYLPNEGYYIVSCSVCNFQDVAKGETIAKAKLSAAAKMLARLQ